MKNIILPSLALLALCLPTVLSADEANWSYSGETGAEYWASLSPDYRLCGSGKNQSPINIDSKTTLDIQNKGIKFNYGHIVPTTLQNTGKYIQVNIDKGSNIKIDELEFELKHLAIHMPSEHTFDNKQFPMEIQLVHESKTGEKAIVALMVMQGNPDRTLNKILQQMPTKIGETVQLADNTLRNIEMKKKFANYTQYSGSITSPPCTEGVRWYILQQALSLSAEQQKQFQDIMSASNRPIQNINARLIFK